VLLTRDEYPFAVFWLPVVLEKRALNPFAVFQLPMELEKRALNPFAVLLVPVVLEASAPLPTTVFDEIFPDHRHTIRPFTRISLHEKLAMILLVVEPE
jgi:hypothetical protein